MSNLEDLYGKIVSNADKKIDKEKNGKILKKIPLTKAQRKTYDEGMKLLDEIKKILGEDALERIQRIEALHRKFWADIELSTGEFMRHLKFDPEKNIIIVYDK